MFDSAQTDQPAPASGRHPGASPGLDPELALRLPADAYYHLVRTLRLTLPPLPAKAGVSDNPEDLLRRDHAALARVAALVPANAAEADLAAMFVAASEQWKDCLRLAQLRETTAEMALKCRAQAIGMMRQAQSALRLLLRMQAARGKREADSTACDSATWTEHCATALMAEALSGHPANSGDFAGTPPAAPTPAAPAQAGTAPCPDPAASEKCFSGESRHPSFLSPGGTMAPGFRRENLPGRGDARRCTDTLAPALSQIRSDASINLVVRR